MRRSTRAAAALAMMVSIVAIDVAQPETVCVGPTGWTEVSVSTAASRAAESPWHANDRDGSEALLLSECRRRAGLNMTDERPGSFVDDQAPSRRTSSGQQEISSVASNGVVSSSPLSGSNAPDSSRVTVPLADLPLAGMSIDWGSS